MKKVYFKCRETKLGNEKLFRFYPGLGAGRKAGEAWEGLSLEEEALASLSSRETVAGAP